MNFLDLLSMYKSNAGKATQQGMQQGAALGEKLQPGLDELAKRWRMGRQSQNIKSYLGPQPVPKIAPVMPL